MIVMRHILLILGLTPPAGCAVWAQIWEREDLIAFASSYHDSMLGLCWPWCYVGCKLGHVGFMLGLRRALLGPRRLMWSKSMLAQKFVGAMLANLGSRLGPHLELCWGYGCVLFSWCHLRSQILLKKALPSGLRVVCLNCLSKICLSSTSAQWPASYTFRARSLPPVA